MPLFLIPKLSYGENIIITNQNASYNITDRLEYAFIDKNHRVNKELIDSLIWKKFDKKALTFGNKNETYLLKSNFENTSQEEHYVISVEQPNIDHFEIFDSNFSSINKTGDIYAWETREFKESYPSFSLYLTQNTSQTYYFLIGMSEDGVCPLKLYPSRKYHEFFAQREWLFGIFIGLMGVIAVYNLFLYFSVNENLYLFYAIYVTTLCLAHSSLLGGLMHHLYSGSLFLSQFDAVIFPAIMAPSAYFFIKEYFSFSFTKTPFKILSFFIAIIIVSGIGLVLLILSFTTVFIVMNVSFVGCYIIIIYIGKISIKFNQFLARIFLTAWSLMLVGGLFYVLITTGLLDYNQNILYLMPIGAALETIILSLALGYRIRILKKEKNKTSQLLETQTQNTKQLQSELKDVELQAIRGQINPHFIFNALNSIQFLIHKPDNEKASLYLTIFSRLIRKSLQYTEMKRISIEDELAFIKDYVEIEQLRFPEPFKFSIEIGQSSFLQDASVPPLITQPFIENAIKHAFTPETKNGELILRININENKELIQIEVQDNGTGIQEKSISHHTSKGLSISEKRLTLLNSEIKNNLLSLDISTSNKNNVGVLVKFSLPLH